MKESSNQQPWLTRKRLVCMGLLLLAAVYILARPTLERWTGLDLPSLIEQDQQPAGDRKGDDGFKPGFEVVKDFPAATDNSNKSNSNRPSSKSESRSASSERRNKFAMRDIGRGALQSPAGLIYEQTRREHRVQHVMRHARDDPPRPVHGVFDADNEQAVLQLIDEAYELAKTNSRQASSQRSGERTEWTIDMKRRIGYVGGKQGKRDRNPPVNRMKLVLDGNRVITAYPTRN